MVLGRRGLEGGEVDARRGEDGRAMDTLLGRLGGLGDPLLMTFVWEDDVAWCRSEGGAVAIAFALARLAAMAAATLPFF